MWHVGTKRGMKIITSSETGTYELVSICPVSFGNTSLRRSKLLGMWKDEKQVKACIAVLSISNQSKVLCKKTKFMECKQQVWLKSYKYWTKMSTNHDTHTYDNALRQYCIFVLLSIKPTSWETLGTFEVDQNRTQSYICPISSCTDPLPSSIGVLKSVWIQSYSVSENPNPRACSLQNNHIKASKGLEYLVVLSNPLQSRISVVQVWSYPVGMPHNNGLIALPAFPYFTMPPLTPTIKSHMEPFS